MNPPREIPLRENKKGGGVVSVSAPNVQGEARFHQDQFKKGDKKRGRNPKVEVEGIPGARLGMYLQKKIKGPD